MMAIVDVELLVLRDCPREAAARTLLRTALDDIGLPGLQFATTVVDSDEVAELRGFVGSPTILINGADPFADASRAPALACRIYPGPGGFVGVPDLRDLRQALKRGAADQPRKRT